MSQEYIEIIILSVLLFITLILYILLKLKSKTAQDEIKELHAEFETKDKEYFKLQRSFKEYKQKNSGTSFVNEKTKKIQSLEAEILKQKKRIEDAKSIAQEANMVKYDFLSNMRHEVRTPMNSILVFAQLLQSEIKDTTLLNYSNNIYNAGIRLLNLMDSIIELSRIESGVFEIKEVAMDVRNMLESSFQRHKATALDKALDLNLTIEDSIPQSLMLDGDMVSEILHNLIENAIKFTDSGYVEVSVVLNNLDESKNLVDFSIIVKDSGMGIDVENQEKIFEIFEKRDNANEIEFQGAGLGLSINRKMARLMNGDVKVQSKLKHGSSFIFTLKGVEIVLSNAEEKIDESKIDFTLLNKANILVIDKQETIKEVQNYFKDSKIELFAYDNLRDAMKTLVSTEINMILIDFDILNMDDGAVSKVISNTTDAKIVTLNSSRIKDIPFDALKIAPIGHLKKPLSKTELFKISLKVLNSIQINSIADLLASNLAPELCEEEKAKLKDFMQRHEKGIQDLFNQASTTNDLNAMKVFAEALYKLSVKFDIKDFTEYSEKLLNYIALFDIDAIEIMLNEYKSKIKRAQNL